MEQNTPVRKPFAPASLPEPLCGLLRNVQLVTQISGADLREMAKLDERTNRHGATAYPLQRPIPEPLRFTPNVGLNALPGLLLSREPLLPIAIEKSLTRLLELHAAILVAGRFGAEGSCPFDVRVIVPLPHARLAAAAERMLWPADHGLAPAEATLDLLWFPDPLTRRSGDLVAEYLVGCWPEAGIALIVGYDDPALFARLVEHAALTRGPSLAPQANPWRAPLKSVNHEPLSTLQAPPLGLQLFGIDVDPAGEFQAPTPPAPAPLLI